MKKFHSKISWCVSLSASHTLTHSPRWAHTPQYAASLTYFWHMFLKYRLIGSWVKVTGDREIRKAFKVTDYRYRIYIRVNHLSETFLGNGRRITTKEQ